MGCYNTIIAKCPTCRGEIEYQSKGGSCELKEFNISEVPIEDALYIQDSSVRCSGCGEYYTAVSTIIIEKMSMMLIKS